MLGYSKEDLDQMSNAVHDAKLFYIRNSDVTYVDQDPLVLMSVVEDIMG